MAGLAEYGERRIADGSKGLTASAEQMRFLAGAAGAMFALLFNALAGLIEKNLLSDPSRWLLVVCLILLGMTALFFGAASIEYMKLGRSLQTEGGQWLAQKIAEEKQLGIVWQSASYVEPVETLAARYTGRKSQDAWVVAGATAFVLSLAAWLSVIVLIVLVGR